MKIDKEFSELLEPLTEEEYKQLESNIIADGCREPLVVWRGVIIDGHNRYNICTEHDIAFKTAAKNFESRDEAMDWIDKNQLGRRNLTFDQMALIIGRRYERAKANGAPKGNANASKQGGQIDHVVYGNTSQRIAAESGVGEATVRRAGRLVKALDTLKDVAPEVEQKIHNKEKVVKGDIIKAAQMVRDGDEEGALEVLEKSVPVHKTAVRVDCDKLGQPLPDHLIKAFSGRKIKGWLKTIKVMLKDINDCEDLERAQLVKQNVESAVRRLRGVLTNAIPYAICPACAGEGCNECYGHGFMPESVYNSYRKEKK